MPIFYLKLADCPGLCLLDLRFQEQINTQVQSSWVGRSTNLKSTNIKFNRAEDYLEGICFLCPKFLSGSLHEVIGCQIYFLKLSSVVKIRPLLCAYNKLSWMKHRVPRTVSALNFFLFGARGNFLGGEFVKLDVSILTPK